MFQKDSSPLAKLPHASHFVAAGCIAFLVGVGIACVWEAPLLGAGAIAVFGFLLAVTHPREIALLGCAVCCFGLGCLRVAMIPENPVTTNRSLDAQAVIVGEPQLRSDRQRVVVEFTDAAAGDTVRAQVDIPLQPRFQTADRVRVQCTLEKPQPSEDFAYDRYLARYHISALCDRRAEVTLVSAGDAWQKQVLAVKRHAVSRVRTVLPLPEQAVVLGMVFGVDHQLPKEIDAQFRTTGTSHLLVISGSQIVLIVAVCMRLLQYAPVRRRTSMLLIAVFLLAYLVMTGWQASVLRAALCACCVFGVELVGRTGGGLRMLMYVATGMVAVNPYLLLYDAGFQLSFLATAGIICFATRLSRRMEFITDAGGFRTATATSIAAMIPTTPLIAYSFHTFSPVSLFTNMVAVPLAGILTVGGFSFSVLAAISPTAAQVVAPGLYTVAHFFLWIVAWFAQLPYASVTIPL